MGEETVDGWVSMFGGSAFRGLRSVSTPFSLGTLRILTTTFETEGRVTRNDMIRDLIWLSSFRSLCVI